jgi:phage terminase small subunit
MTQDDGKKPAKATDLTERERRFVEHFMASGNATKAAEKAGYSKKTSAQIGYRLVRKVQIQRAIGERAANDPTVWTREERQQFWTAVASGSGSYRSSSLRDRLKASELLGRSQADFVERHAVGGRLTLEEAIAASRQI